MPRSRRSTFDGIGGRLLRQCDVRNFNATLECELVTKHRFKTQREALLAVFEFIEGWYNPHRRHSALGYLSPINYERRMAEAA